MTPRSGSRWAFALLGAGLVAGCGVPLKDIEEEPANRCSDQTQCGGGATCTPDGTCVAREASLDGLVLELEGVDAAGSAAEGLFLSLDPPLPESSTAGLVIRRDVFLPERVVVTGEVVTESSTPCFDTPGPIGATLEFRRDSVAGLPVRRFSTKTDPQTAGFELALYAGTYDIHVTPLRPDGCTGFELAPYVIRGQRIDANRRNLSLKARAAALLTGQVSFPTSTSFEGWSLSVVDRVDGLVLSNQQPLSGTGTADIAVRYNWVPDDGLPPLVRMAFEPAAGVESEPTSKRGVVHWPLDLVATPNEEGTEARLDAAIDQAFVPFRAVVLDSATQSPVEAQVVIKSRFAAAPQVAFSLTTQTNGQGEFVGEILPGTYDLVARPLGQTSLYGIGRSSWTVPDRVDDCWCGQTVLLEPQRAIRGFVQTPAGEAFVGASIVTTPSRPLPMTYFASVLAPEAVLIRQEHGSLDGKGRFEVTVAGGQYDMSIRPLTVSAYPWLVLPRLDVQVDGQELGGLTMPFPAMVTGTLRRFDGTAYGGGTLNAWKPTFPDPEQEEPTYVQIGRTEIGEQGAFRLLLPPR